MSFKDRLNLLFSELEFSNIMVSKRGKLDPSLISRFRTGSRIPSADSRQLTCLCRGIVAMAEEENKTELISRCCDIAYVNTQQFCRELEHWLGNGGADLKPRRRKSTSSGVPVIHNGYLKAFSEKMDALMTTFDIQNIKLARAIHVDASLISRFRTGMRIPTTDSWFPNSFCEWFAQRILELPRQIYVQKLKPLIGSPVPDTEASMKERLYEWMNTDPESGENQMMDSLLERLNSYRPQLEMPSELPEALYTQAVTGEAEAFSGIAGLREAVIKFLSIAATRQEPVTLYLYSDQPLDWLTGDPEFAKKWSALMALVLQRKNRICIIHNISRELSEMLEAIRKWLPLYMTGLIQAYYYPELQKSRFYRTMFIIPGIISIDASFVAGTDDLADYHFNSGKKTVDYYYHQFSALLKKSKRLIRIFPFQKPDEFRLCCQAVKTTGGHSKHLRDTLSIATMPEDLFEEIISRSEMNSSEKEIAFEYRQINLHVYESGINSGGITELAAMAGAGKLLSQNVRIDLPVGGLYYRPDEYARHIQNVIYQLETHPAYTFCPLPDVPFENVLMSVWDSRHSLIIKTDEPAIAFMFDNRSMNYAVSEYLKSMKKRALRGDYHKDKVIARLRQCL